MLFHKPLKPQSISNLLQQISQYTSDILVNSSTKLSYQLAYDKVYQLCQQQKQQQLLAKIYQSIEKVLPQVFNKLDMKSQRFVNDVTEMIEKTERNLQMIRDVCLYLDINYCKKDLNCPLIDKLNEIFREEFFSRQQLLVQLGSTIAECHLSGNQIAIENLIKEIKTIDYQEDYFLNHFVKYYLPVISVHFNNQAEEKFALYDSTKKLQAYINYAHQMLENEENFLNRFWPDSKKCASNKTFIMKQLYQKLVTRFKPQMYINHKETLFNELTLQILELFKYNPKSNDIQKHAEWYNSQIKQKLSTLNQQNNTLFITSICQFYNKIMWMLQKTHNKFDIHYRSRFAFQEWINEERLQMPLRLNEYIDEYCHVQKEKSVMENIGIVFVLMKEKNAFEKIYRRQLIDRRLARCGEYDIAREQKVIALMQKQCSEQFVKNIHPIIQSSTASTNETPTPHSQLNVLPLHVQNWPYDQKHTTAITINEQLLNLTKAYTISFNEQHKDKSLYWHPIVGVVIVKMNFLESRWQGELTLNTCMANLLLNFTKTAYHPYELKTFCLQTGYMLDHLYQSVKKLLLSKILLNQGSQDNYILTINQSFSHQSNQYNVTKTQTTNKFESKPLEQLKADRKFMVEAIIVKIMKKVKNTDKEAILKQTAPMIEKRGFSFNAKFVQSAIQRLVDKQFLRDYQDGKYGYIA